MTVGDTSTTYTVESGSILSNALVPIVTESGIVMDAKLIDDMNASAPILVMESGSVMDVNPVAEKKAFLPILLSWEFTPKVTDVNPDSANVNLPILVTEFGIDTDVNVFAYLNAESPMLVTESPIITCAMFDLLI